MTVDDTDPLELEPEINPETEMESEDNSDGDDGEEGDGKDGKKGGSGGKKPADEVELEESLFVDNEDLSAYDSESLIEKLKLLVWAPFSGMVPGATSFESEQDLKRKLFLGQIGLITNQIKPEDIADPDMIAKLERRNQERQAQFKAEQAATLLASGAAGLAEIPDLPDPVRETKAEAQKPKEASVDARKENENLHGHEEDAEIEEEKVKKVYESKPENISDIEALESKPQDQGDFARQDIIENTGMDVGDMIDILDRQRETAQKNLENSQPQGLDAIGTISTAFNALAQQTEYTAPQQKIELKFADPAPKLDVGGGPMG